MARELLLLALRVRRQDNSRTEPVGGRAATFAAMRGEIAAGDWRLRFRKPVSECEQLTFLSFDPDMFNRHGSKDIRKMKPSDLDLVAAAVTPITGNVLIQLSTYDVNSGNSQEDVRDAIVSCLKGGGLELLAVVQTDRRMMSLVLGNIGVPVLVSDIGLLPGRFKSWLRRVKAGAASGGA